jgi:cytochrome P450
MTKRAEVDFDHMGADFAVDPAAAFAALRQQCPMAWTPHHGGFWVPTSHEAIALVARDDATFSSARHPADSPNTAITLPGTPSTVSIPIELDPPEFNAYRRLLNPLLSPAAVEELRPRFEALSNEFIDGFISHGRCDLIHDYSGPVMATFTMEWLGMPTNAGVQFAEVFHGFTAYRPGAPERDRAIAAKPALDQLITDEIDRHRREPDGGVLTQLLGETVNGLPIATTELHAMIHLLIAGGVDTTSSLVGQGLMHLHHDRAARQRLQDEPQRLPLAVEEFLRVFSPVVSNARTVTHDVEVCGQTLRAGDRVLLPWAAANRDPAVFPDPDAVVLERSPNRHASFGLGIHRCVGSNVARVATHVMIEAVLRRLPDYSIDVDGAEAYPARGRHFGWSALPTTFTPQPASRV